MCPTTWIRQLTSPSSQALPLVSDPPPSRTITSPVSSCQQALQHPSVSVPFVSCAADTAVCLSPQSTMRAWWRICRYAKHSKCDICVHKKNEKLSARSASRQTIPLFFPLSAVCWSWSAGPPISKWSLTSKNAFPNGCTSPTTIASREGTSTWRRDGRLHCKLVALASRTCQQAKERVAVAAYKNNVPFGQEACWLVVLLVGWK